MRGPKLRRINGDSTWLIQIPLDQATWFNVLIDPWLDDASQVDFAPSFSEQRRIVPSLAQSVFELESLLRSEEEQRLKKECKDNSEDAGTPTSHQIDAILVSHPFSDHAHPETLLDESLPARIPIYTTREAGKRLRSLLAVRSGSGKAQRQNEEREIIDIEVANMDEEMAPRWLRDGNLQGQRQGDKVHFAFLPAQESIFSLHHGVAWPSLHGAIVILYRLPDASSSADVGSILYSPHGIAPTSIPRWLSRLTQGTLENSEVSTTSSEGQAQRAQDETKAKHVLIQSFDRQELPWILAGVVATGLPGAIELISPPHPISKRLETKPAAAYQADYVLATHDEHKEASGLVARLLRRNTLGQPGLDGSMMQLTEIQEQAQSLIDGACDGQRLKEQVKALVLSTEDRLQL